RNGDAGRARGGGGAAGRGGIPQAAGERVAKPATRFRSLNRVTRYTSATAADRAEMLAAIGVEKTAELFEQVPEPLRLGRPLDLPDGLGESEVLERLAELAAR